MGEGGDVGPLSSGRSTHGGHKGVRHCLYLTAGQLEPHLSHHVTQDLDFLPKDTDVKSVPVFRNHNLPPPFMHQGIVYFRYRLQNIAEITYY